MILGKEQITKMCERVKSFAKVSVPKDEKGDYVERTLISILDYIDYFNALGEYAVQVFDIPLEEIPILNEFKDFVLPKSVKINAADLDCVEMLIQPDIKVKKGMNYADYLNKLMDFRSLFKEDISNNVVKLSDLRKAVSWSEIRDVACYQFESDEGKVFFAHEGDNPFVPIQLTPTMAGTMKSRYFNITLNEMLDDYLEKWLI